MHTLLHTDLSDVLAALPKPASDGPPAQRHTAATTSTAAAPSHPYPHTQDTLHEEGLAEEGGEEEEEEELQGVSSFADVGASLDAVRAGLRGVTLGASAGEGPAAGPAVGENV